MTLSPPDKQQQEQKKKLTEQKMGLNENVKMPVECSSIALGNASTSDRKLAIKVSVFTSPSLLSILLLSLFSSEDGIQVLIH